MQNNIVELSLLFLQKIQQKHTEYKEEIESKDSISNFTKSNARILCLGKEWSADFMTKNIFGELASNFDPILWERLTKMGHLWDLLKNVTSHELNQKGPEISQWTRIMIRNQVLENLGEDTTNYMNIKWFLMCIKNLDLIWRICEVYLNEPPENELEYFLSEIEMDRLEQKIRSHFKASPFHLFENCQLEIHSSDSPLIKKYNEIRRNQPGILVWRECESCSILRITKTRCDRLPVCEYCCVEENLMAWLKETFNKEQENSCCKTSPSWEKFGDYTYSEGFNKEQFTSIFEFVTQRVGTSKVLHSNVIVLLSFEKMDIVAILTFNLSNRMCMWDSFVQIRKWVLEGNFIDLFTKTFNFSDLKQTLSFLSNDEYIISLITDAILFNSLQKESNCMEVQINARQLTDACHLENDYLSFCGGAETVARCNKSLVNNYHYISPLSVELPMEKLSGNIYTGWREPLYTTCTTSLMSNMCYSSITRLQMTHMGSERPTETISIFSPFEFSLENVFTVENMTLFSHSFGENLQSYSNWWNKLSQCWISNFTKKYDFNGQSYENFKSTRQNETTFAWERFVATKQTWSLVVDGSLSKLYKDWQGKQVPYNIAKGFLRWLITHQKNPGCHANLLVLNSQSFRGLYIKRGGRYHNTVLSLLSVPVICLSFNSTLNGKTEYFSDLTHHTSPHMGKDLNKVENGANLRENLREAGVNLIQLAGSYPPNMKTKLSKINTRELWQRCLKDLIHNNSDQLDNGNPNPIHSKMKGSLLSGSCFFLHNLWVESELSSSFCEMTQFSGNWFWDIQSNFFTTEKGHSILSLLSEEGLRQRQILKSMDLFRDEKRLLGSNLINQLTLESMRRSNLRKNLSEISQIKQFSRLKLTVAEINWQRELEESWNYFTKGLLKFPPAINLASEKRNSPSDDSIVESRDVNLLYSLEDYILYQKMGCSRYHDSKNPLRPIFNGFGNNKNIVSTSRCMVKSIFYDKKFLSERHSSGNTAFEFRDLTLRRSETLDSHLHPIGSFGSTETQLIPFFEDFGLVFKINTLHTFRNSPLKESEIQNFLCENHTLFESFDTEKALKIEHISKRLIEKANCIISKHRKSAVDYTASTSSLLNVIGEEEEEDEEKSPIETEIDVVELVKGFDAMVLNVFSSLLKSLKSTPPEIQRKKVTLDIEQDSSVHVYTSWMRVGKTHLKHVFDKMNIFNIYNPEKGASFMLQTTETLVCCQVFRWEGYTFTIGDENLSTKNDPKYYDINKHGLSVTLMIDHELERESGRNVPIIKSNHRFCGLEEICANLGLEDWSEFRSSNAKYSGSNDFLQSEWPSEYLVSLIDTMNIWFPRKRYNGRDCFYIGQMKTFFLLMCHWDYKNKLRVRNMVNSLESDVYKPKEEITRKESELNSWCRNELQSISHHCLLLNSYNHWLFFDVVKRTLGNSSCCHNTNENTNESSMDLKDYKRKTFYAIPLTKLSNIWGNISSILDFGPLKSDGPSRLCSPEDPSAIEISSWSAMTNWIKMYIHLYINTQTHNSNNNSTKINSKNHDIGDRELRYPLRLPDELLDRRRRFMISKFKGTSGYLDNSMESWICQCEICREELSSVLRVNGCWYICDVDSNLNASKLWTPPSCSQLNVAFKNMQREDFEQLIWNFVSHKSLPQFPLYWSQYDVPNFAPYSENHSYQRDEKYCGIPGRIPSHFRSLWNVSNRSCEDYISDEYFNLIHNKYKDESDSFFPQQFRPSVVKEWQKRYFAAERSGSKPDFIDCDTVITKEGPLLCHNLILQRHYYTCCEIVIQLSLGRMAKEGILTNTNKFKPNYRNNQETRSWMEFGEGRFWISHNYKGSLKEDIIHIPSWKITKGLYKNSCMISNGNGSSNNLSHDRVSSKLTFERQNTEKCGNFDNLDWISTRMSSLVHTRLKRIYDEESKRWRDITEDLTERKEAKVDALIMTKKINYLWTKLALACRTFVVDLTFIPFEMRSPLFSSFYSNDATSRFEESNESNNFPDYFVYVPFLDETSTQKDTNNPFDSCINTRPQFGRKCVDVEEYGISGESKLTFRVHLKDITTNRKRENDDEERDLQSSLNFPLINSKYDQLDTRAVMSVGSIVIRMYLMLKPIIDKLWDQLFSTKRGGRDPLNVETKVPIILEFLSAILLTTDTLSHNQVQVTEMKLKNYWKGNPDIIRPIGDRKEVKICNGLDFSLICPSKWKIGSNDVKVMGTNNSKSIFSYMTNDNIVTTTTTSRDKFKKKDDSESVFIEDDDDCSEIDNGGSFYRPVKPKIAVEVEATGSNDNRQQLVFVQCGRTYTNIFPCIKSNRDLENTNVKEDNDFCYSLELAGIYPEEDFNRVIQGNIYPPKSPNVHDPLKIHFATDSDCLFMGRNEIVCENKKHDLNPNRMVGIKNSLKNVDPVGIQVGFRYEDPEFVSPLNDKNLLQRRTISHVEFSTPDEMNVEISNIQHNIRIINASLTLCNNLARNLKELETKTINPNENIEFASFYDPVTKPFFEQNITQNNSTFTNATVTTTVRPDTQPNNANIEKEEREIELLMKYYFIMSKNLGKTLKPELPNYGFVGNNTDTGEKGYQDVLSYITPVIWTDYYGLRWSNEPEGLSVDLTRKECAEWLVDNVINPFVD